VSNENYTICVICSENNSKKHRNKHWLRYLAQKANSRKKDNSVKITEEMLQVIHDRQKGCCVFTKIPFSMSQDSTKPSLDRICSKQGYTPENLQLVIMDINKIKREFPVGYFYSLCLLVAGNYDPTSAVKEHECVGGVCGV
jgi:hypothetical protein